jgi:hypothetical protein
MSEHDKQEGAMLPPPSPGRSRLTKGETATIMRSVAEVLGPLVKRIAELETRCKSLEAKPSLRYCGVWKADVRYGEGAAVTQDGSLWIARAIAPPGEKPGDSDAWQLAVKRGRDGRDGGR